MSTVAAKISGAHNVVLPCPDETKRLLNEALSKYDGAIDVFCKAYRSFLNKHHKNWEGEIQSLAGHFEVLAGQARMSLEDYVSKDNESGYTLDHQQFIKWCKIAENSIVYKAPPSIVKRLSVKQLQEVHKIAKDDFGTVNESNMELAYDMYKDMQKQQQELQKANEQKQREEARKKALAKRGMSVSAPPEDDTESDDEEKIVSFIASGKRARKRNRDEIDNARAASPYGLATTLQIDDMELLAQQFLDTSLKWFQQPGVMEWLEEDTPNAAKLKRVYEAIQG